MRLAGFIICFFVPFLSIAQVKDTTYANQYAQEYQERISKAYINGRYIPKDVDDAMRVLDEVVDPDGQERFRVQPEDRAVKMIHFSFGRWMIVNWGFYEGSRLSHTLREKGITYPDDMASTLMYCYHRKLNDQPMQLDSLAAHFSELRRLEVEERLKQGTVIESEGIRN